MSFNQRNSRGSSKVGTQQTALTRHMPKMVDVMDLPNRLAVQRSSPYELVKLNGTAHEETATAVAKLMSQDLRTQVGSALRSTQIEMTPAIAGQLETGTISALLSKFIGITGGGWSKAQQSEWVGLVAGELADLPYLLVEPALREAIGEVEYPAKLLVWIMARIGPALAALKEEKRILEYLVSASDANS